jgi:carbonic anhydrase
MQMITQPTKLFLFFILMAGLTLAGCDLEKIQEHADDGHSWAYEGENGPDHWGALNSEWEACSEGREQSPINLTSAVVFEIDDPVFSYHQTDLNLKNNGHTIQQTYAAGSSMEVDDVVYQLLQFHFHSPAEHSVDGVLSPMELHLVHQAADGSLAVVGLLIEAGDFNPAFNGIMNGLPILEDEVHASDGIQVNAANFLPVARTTYRYAGSLTTPPCSQGVAWMVMTNKIQLSAEQIALYTDIFHATNRPVQLLNDRVLVQDAS